MAKLTTEELIEQFKELTLIELSEFVKAFEETFDVTAAAPAAVAGAAAPGADNQVNLPRLNLRRAFRSRRQNTESPFDQSIHR